MFYVTTERFEIKTGGFGFWTADDIIEAYQNDNYHQEEIIFESDLYQQAQMFFDYEKNDCKTFFDYYLKADVICLYCDDELMKIYVAPLH